MGDAETTDATSTETAEVTMTEAVTTEATDDIEAMREALKKANAEAKKFRLAAKANETELEKARTASMSEQEKAVATAKVEGRTEALREAGAARVEDAIRAAASGRVADIDALIDGIDRAKFLDDEGNPDREAIQTWVEKIAPTQEDRGDGFGRTPDLAQGTRSAPALGSDPLTETLTRMVGR